MTSNMKTAPNRPNQNKSKQINIPNQKENSEPNQTNQTKNTNKDKFKFCLSLAQLSPSLFHIFTVMYLKSLHE